MIVKIPVTRAGVAAIEEATYRGVSINATVSFSLPQCLAVAEAVERGLKRRERERLDIASMGPVCTIMVGRLDDWLKVVAEKKDIITNPGTLDWAGVAVFKRAYGIFRERGYRLRLLSAAFRNHLHWSEFIGGDVVISPPYRWQVRYNASDVVVKDHMSTPVEREDRRRAPAQVPRLHQGLRAGRAHGRGVRRLPADAPYAAAVHRGHARAHGDDPGADDPGPGQGVGAPRQWTGE